MSWTDHPFIQRAPRTLYTDALRTPGLDEKISMKLRGQHEIGGFFIGGMGEEIHGMAQPKRCGMDLDFRSGGQLRILLDSFSYRSVLY